MGSSKWGVTCVCLSGLVVVVVHQYLIHILIQTNTHKQSWRSFYNVILSWLWKLGVCWWVVGGVLQDLVNLHNRSFPSYTKIWLTRRKSDEWQDGPHLWQGPGKCYFKLRENFQWMIDHWDDILWRMLSDPSVQCSGGLCFVTRLLLSWAEVVTVLSRSQSDASQVWPQSVQCDSQPACQPAGWGCYDDKYPSQTDQTFNITKCPEEGESLSFIVGIDFRLNVEIFML